MSDAKTRASKQIEADRERELEQLDLLSKTEGERRADGLLCALLETPPEPFTPKPKAVKKRAGKPAK